MQEVCHRRHLAASRGARSTTARRRSRLPAGRQRLVPVVAAASALASIAAGPSSAPYRRLTYTQPVSVIEVPAGFQSPGHETARDAAVRAASAGRLQRTILVHGPRGAGKRDFVDDLLALLLCREPTPGGLPCNACRSCRDARGRSHPDLVVASPRLWREARSTGESIVAVARRWLLESSGTPIAGERRVIVIEDLDQANEQTQNALLKALEEPSARQMFILVADDLDRVLPTIVSRSQLLRVGAIPREELVAWLMEDRQLPAEQADALARIADGLPGRARAYADNAQLVEWRRRTQQELLGLLGSGRADRFSSVRDLLDQPTPMIGDAQPLAEEGDEAPRTTSAQQRARALQIVEAWRGLGRDLLVGVAGRGEATASAHLLNGFPDAVQPLASSDVTRFLAVLGRAEEALRQNASPRLALEVAMLAWPRVEASSASGRHAR